MSEQVDPNDEVATGFVQCLVVRPRQRMRITKGQPLRVTLLTFLWPGRFLSVYSAEIQASCLSILQILNLFSHPTTALSVAAAPA